MSVDEPSRVENESVCENDNDMLAHGVTHILTLNPGDFARYSEITTVTPSESPNR